MGRIDSTIRCSDRPMGRGCWDIRCPGVVDLHSNDVTILCTRPTCLQPMLSLLREKSSKVALRMCPHPPGTSVHPASIAVSIRKDSRATVLMGWSQPRSVSILFRTGSLRGQGGLCGLRRWHLLQRQDRHRMGWPVAVIRGGLGDAVHVLGPVDHLTEDRVT